MRTGACGLDNLGGSVTKSQSEHWKTAEKDSKILMLEAKNLWSLKHIEEIEA